MFRGSKGLVPGHELAEAGLELWRQLCSPPHQASSTQV